MSACSAVFSAASPAAAGTSHAQRVVDVAKQGVSGSIRQSFFFPPVLFRLRVAGQVEVHGLRGPPSRMPPGFDPGSADRGWPPKTSSHCGPMRSGHQRPVPWSSCTPDACRPGRLLPMPRPGPASAAGLTARRRPRRRPARLPGPQPLPPRPGPGLPPPLPPAVTSQARCARWRAQPRGPVAQALRGLRPR